MQHHAHAAGVLERSRGPKVPGQEHSGIELPNPRFSRAVQSGVHGGDQPTAVGPVVREHAANPAHATPAN